MSPRAYSQEPSPSQSSALRSAPQISARVAPDSGVRGRTRSRSRSQSRSVSPVARRRSSSVRHSRSRSRTPHLQDHTNGHGARGLRPSRSPLQTRDERRSYRQRSYSRGSSRQDRRIESSKIVVEKLTRNVTEAHLQEIFGAYGRIHSIDIPMNRQFMTNRGSAYIVYDSAAGSESAIAHMHEAQLDGAVITVSIVLPRRAFSRSPPPARSERRPYPNSRHQEETSTHRSPPRRGGYGDRRPTAYSSRNNQRARSRSPARRRERSHSYDSRSPSRTPPRRRPREPPRRRQRSPSYSSYTSASRSRSRSRSRSESRVRRNVRR